MKVSILLMYYNRPILVRKALQSILDSHEHHPDWRLLIGHYVSRIPAEPIAREMLADHLDKVDFINSGMSVEDKLKHGIAIGRFANEYLSSIDADVVITLCDDDMLVPTYLKDLCVFFEKHTECMYAYSDVLLYNPILGGVSGGSSCHYNNGVDGSPAGKLDASQVAFRLDCCRVHGARFPETTSMGTMPYVANVDAGFYQQLYEKFGPPVKTGLVGQYKGIHDYQLVWHKKQGAWGLRNYIEKVEGLAGKVL